MIVYLWEYVYGYMLKLDTLLTIKICGYGRAGPNFTLMLHS